MYWAVAAIVIVLDRLSKMWVKANLDVGSGFTVIPKLLDFTHVQNTGAAFSNFQGKGTALIIVTTLLMVLITVYVYVPKFKATKAEKLCLGMILGGGAGNLICRIIQGYVTDFINIHILPVFNVADIFICIGCALMLIITLFDDRRE